MDTQDSGTRGRASALASVGLGMLGLVLVTGGLARPAAGARATTATIVVTARSVAAGEMLAAGDVEVRQEAGGVADLGGALASPAEAVGRRAVLALPAGVPVLRFLLAGTDTPAPGHRVVRLHLDAASLPPALQAGQPVDVLAAIADGPSQEGRLLRVATGSLVSVATDEGASSPSASPASQATVALDVDAAAAARLLWAQSFAKSLSLLAAPPGDDAGSVPAEVDGVAPSGTGR